MHEILSLPNDKAHGISRKEARIPPVIEEGASLAPGFRQT